MNSAAPDEALLLSIAQGSMMLGCSTRLVEKLIASGELGSVRLGKRARRIPRHAVVDYIARLEREQVDGDVESLAPEALRLVRRASGRR